MNPHSTDTTLTTTILKGFYLFLTFRFIYNKYLLLPGVVTDLKLNLQSKKIPESLNCSKMQVLRTKKSSSDHYFFSNTFWGITGVK